MAEGGKKIDTVLKTPDSVKGVELEDPTPKRSVANTIKTSRKKIQINCVGSKALTTVPGIGIKFATKLINLRSMVGNLTPDMLVACIGGKVNKAMLSALDFVKNPSLEEDSDPEPEEEEGKGVLDPEGKMKDMLLSVMKGLVTPEKASKGTSKSRSVKEDESEDDLEEARPSPKGGRRRRGHMGLPKNLLYDGKSNWAAFKQKSERYTNSNEWTEQECLDNLCFSLMGKAADFHATIMERNGDLPYRSLLKKLEKRFGAKELAETTQAQFQQATQADHESLEDWADRVLTLATKAFRELPEKYANQQAVVRFCQGLHDKTAAQDVSMKRHGTIEEAVDHVKWFQHVHHDVYGKPKTTRRTRDYDEEAAQVYDASRETCDSSSRTSSVTNTEVEKMVEKMGEQLLLRLSAVATSEEKPRKTLDGACFQCGQQGHIRRNCPESKCFLCQKIGHFKRDCPEAKKGLNGSRSSVGPHSRPRK